EAQKLEATMPVPFDLTDNFGSNVLDRMQAIRAKKGRPVHRPIANIVSCRYFRLSPLSLRRRAKWPASCATPPAFNEAQMAHNAHALGLRSRYFVPVLQLQCSRTGKERGGSASPSSLEPRAWLSA